MIKINLLTTIKSSKGGKFKKEFVVLIGCVVLLLVLLSLVQWRMSKAAEETSARIAATKAEIAKCEAEIAEALQAQLDIINTLRREKSIPAKLLDEVSMQKPPRLHLEGLKKEGRNLVIEGISLDDETVAMFMTNLRKSQLFKNVDLIVSEQTEVNKIKLKKFKLSCEINLT
jgi:type IV pilus assembly protein PilN